MSILKTQKGSDRFIGQQFERELLASLLLKGGALRGVRDSSGRTPLDWAHAAKNPSRSSDSEVQTPLVK